MGGGKIVLARGACASTMLQGCTGVGQADGATVAERVAWAVYHFTVDIIK